MKYKTLDEISKLAGVSKNIIIERIHIWKGFSDCWDKLKDYSKDIQFYMDNNLELSKERYKSRLCYVCGEILKSNMSRHMISHSKDPLSYLLWENNLIELPKCPYCNDLVRYDLRNHIIRETCGSISCARKLSNYTKSYTGTHHFLSKNLIRNDQGKSIYHISGNRNSTINGTNHLLSKNLVRDENGLSIIHKNIIKSKSLNGTLSFRGYRSIVVIDDNEFKLDSQYELIAIFYLLVFHPEEKLLDNSIRYNNPTSEFNGLSAYSDIRTYNNGIITNWEVHDELDNFSVFIRMLPFMPAPMH
jgi:hypothetical protein